MPEEYWDIEKEDTPKREPQPLLPINWGTATHQWMIFVSPTSMQSVWGLSSFFMGDERMMRQKMSSWEERTERVGDGTPRDFYGYHPTDFMQMAPTLNSVGTQLANTIVWAWLQSQEWEGDAGPDDQNKTRYYFEEYTPAILIESLNGHKINSKMFDLMRMYGTSREDEWWKGPNDGELEAWDYDYDGIPIKDFPSYSENTNISRRITYSADKNTLLSDMGDKRLVGANGFMPALTWSGPDGLVSAVYNDLSSDGGGWVQIVAYMDWTEIWDRNDEALHIQQIDVKMKKLLKFGFNKFIEWINKIPERHIPFMMEGGAGTNRGERVLDEDEKPVGYNWGSSHKINWVAGDVSLVKRANSTSNMREDLNQGKFVTFKL